ncbi:B12-binding domain-containing radical SAM protein [Desulfuromonas carbonis]|uniref:lipid biosynthesis B12-binding/radical SAM protein n=1 Tax=Desulfuromonas sp. DDH964 TaxID=1823759 RepID=UPI00078B1916|nr:lipid biosynthesis B12-binding/radical SAM protein [Desulfuromonas sp. DDH964]AMV72131.1 radical SAM domain-containing iron-sulfur cluster-binding oxidoreductase [Desulfuromonas sp. DDH964]
MSRIFCLSSNVTTEPYPVYPLGMAVIAGALSRSGHEVRQFDFLVSGCSEQALLDAVTEFGPEFICLSLRNIDNVDSFSAENAWYVGQARRLVELLRSVSRAPVIVGGPGFSILPEEILAYLGADHGVVGEGEGAVCSLVADLAAGKTAPALLAGSPPLAGGAQGGPLLCRELVDYYVEQTGMVNLQTKRGCPHDCVYCTYPSLEGKRFRPRSAGAVVDDIEQIGRDFGVKGFFFTDSVFNDARGEYLELAEEILRRNLEISFSAFFRPQGIGRRELALLKRAGLHAAELGTDAASDTTLAGIDKGFTFADVFEVNRACVAERIPAAHFIIFGGPDETMATVAEGLDNIASLEHCAVFAFSGIRILPGTRMLERAIADGIITAGAPLLMPVYYFSPLLDPEGMNAAILKSFQGRRDRIFPPSEGQVRMSVMRRFGFRGLLWDRLIAFPREELA